MKRLTDLFKNITTNYFSKDKLYDGLDHATQIMAEHGLERVVLDLVEIPKTHSAHFDWTRNRENIRYPEFEALSDAEHSLMEDSIDYYVISLVIKKSKDVKSPTKWGVEVASRRLPFLGKFPFQTYETIGKIYSGNELKHFAQHLQKNGYNISNVFDRVNEAIETRNYKLAPSLKVA